MTSTTAGLEIRGIPVIIQSVEIVVRSCEPDEVPRFLRTVESAFHDEMSDESIARYSRVVDPSRMLMACDGDEMVGTSGSFEFSLSVPGGEAPAAGVTVVGVLPSHRRRGVLTKMMRRLTDDARARGEHLAILFASEEAIYQRFGYGLGARQSRMKIARTDAVFRPGRDVEGRTRLVTEEEAVKILPDVYDRVRARTPGMFARSKDWWEAHRLVDDKDHRRGGGPMFRAVWETGGRAEAYALYRVHPSGPPDEWRSYLRAIEVLGTDPDATRAIWKFVFGVDLVEEILMWILPQDHPLQFMLLEPSALNLTMDISLWLRVVDVPGALGARTYGTDGVLTFALSDAFCQWNEKVWKLTVDGGRGSVSTGEGSPNLELDACDLGVVYLGGIGFSELAQAGRVIERTPGALATADAMFRSAPAPWCPEVF